MVLDARVPLTVASAGAGRAGSCTGAPRQESANRFGGRAPLVKCGALHRPETLLHRKGLDYLHTLQLHTMVVEGLTEPSGLLAASAKRLHPESVLIVRITSTA
jgi:hypothetical protein